MIFGEHVHMFMVGLYAQGLHSHLVFLQSFRSSFRCGRFPVRSHFLFFAIIYIGLNALQNTKRLPSPCILRVLLFSQSFYVLAAGSTRLR